MFEAYARNKYVSTGVIQWMLNNAWPSLIWHLYDYYLVPTGGYFGTKKACEPVHIQYSYDDNSVAVINGTYADLPGMRATAKIYDIAGAEKASKNATLELGPDSSNKAFDLPDVPGISKTYFVKLQLHDAKGKLVSDNFYWLSSKLDTLDWEHKQDTVYTPQKEFADLTGLNSLPQVKLSVTAAATKNEQANGGLRVTVKNPSTSVAFMAHLRLTQGQGGADVVPVFWEENYFSLLPGESREVTVSYPIGALEGKAAVVEVDGYNVSPITVTP